MPNTDPEVAKVDPYITGFMLMGVNLAAVAEVTVDKDAFDRDNKYFKSLSTRLEHRQLSHE